jgi:NAD(P)-dependent dehydrogenase (short-subunit alcohol dehydrogenase family)
MTPDRSRTRYGAHSTATDVLDGVDLTGRTAIVTGGYSGLGLETVRALTGAGARVVVPARRPEVARSALADVNGAEVDELDLGDLASVTAFAGRFLGSHPTLDIVIANAAIMACPETRVGSGWEAQFAVNHLGHYALVNLLWPALAAAGSARVVSVASGYDPDSRIRWHDVHFERGYDKWEAYGQAKLANVLFARQLDLLGRPYGVRAFSVNPGYILTPLQRHLGLDEMVAAGWVDADGTPAPGLFKTVQQGAATQTWAATSPQLDGRGGSYCLDCAVAEIDPARETTVPREAARLWALSADLTGIDCAA